MLNFTEPTDMNNQEELFKPDTNKPLRDAFSLPEGEIDKLEPFESVDKLEYQRITPAAFDGEGNNHHLDEMGFLNLNKEHTGEEVMNSIGMYQNRGMTPQEMYDYYKKNGQFPPYYENVYKEIAIIAIDPGSSGSITLLPFIGEIISTKMPDTPKDVFDLLKYAKNKYSVTCYMEKVQGLPGMGGSPMFNFGKGYGHLEMALLALEIQTVTIRPQEWQKTLGIGTKGKSSTTEWKNKLKAKAQQLFPSVKVTLWNADALLIGWYAQNLKK